MSFDFHPHERGVFAPLDAWAEAVVRELDLRRSVGFDFEGPPVVRRLDLGIDFGFCDPELGRAFYEALRDWRFAKGRRVQERQPGWFSVLGRGTRRPVLYGRVYDKGVETGSEEAWKWIRTERIVRWERRDAIRLSSVTSGSLRFAYDDVFFDGLAPGVVVRSSGLADALVRSVVSGRINLSAYEQLAGFLLAESIGAISAVYAGRPDLRSRRSALARNTLIDRTGSRTTVNRELDLHAMVASGRELWARAG